MLFIISLLWLSGCQEALNQVEKDASNKKSSLVIPSVSSISIKYDYVIVAGENLDKILTGKISGGVNNHNLYFYEKKSTQLKLGISSGTGLTFSPAYTYTLSLDYSGGSIAKYFNFVVADEAIKTNKLINGAVTSSKIANGSVGSGHLDSANAFAGAVLMYSQTQNKFIPQSERVTGSTVGNGLMGLTPNIGFENTSTISTTGVLDLNIGDGANQIIASNSNNDLSLKYPILIDFGLTNGGMISFYETSQLTYYGAYTDDSFKLKWTADYTVETDPLLYTKSLEIDTDGDTVISGSLAVHGQMQTKLSSNSILLPAGRGSAGQMLLTDGAGGTSWQTRNFPGTGTLTSITAGAGVVVTNPTSSTIRVALDVGTGVGQVVQVDGSGKVNVALIPYGIDATQVGAGSVDNTELSHLDGVTSNIQGQFNALANSFLPVSSILTNFNSETPTANNFIVGDGSNWQSTSAAASRTAFGLGTMALVNYNAVAITGASSDIDGVVIGSATPAAVSGTNITADGLNLTSNFAFDNGSASGFAKATSYVSADNDGNDMRIGVLSPYTNNYAAMWKGGNSDYAVLANTTTAYLNANNATGSVYLRADDSDILIADGSSGDVTIDRGDLIVDEGGIVVNGERIMQDDDYWVRTYGNTGWRNETHGGGWYMSDATMVRSYNDKDVSTGGLIRADLTVIGRHPDEGSSYVGLWKWSEGYSFLTNGSNTYINAPSDATDARIYFRFDNDTEMYLRSDGDLLLENSTAEKPGGGNWAATSDRRLKNVIGPYHRGLEEILETKAVNYFYNVGNIRGHDERELHIGVVAQEVLPYFPEAVYLESDGYYSVQTEPINWGWINAIKTLDGKLSKDKQILQQIELEDQGLGDRIQKITKQNQILAHQNKLFGQSNEAIRAALCELEGNSKECQRP